VSLPSVSPAVSSAPQTVAGFDTFDAAWRAEAYLIRSGVPAADLSIVGTDLHLRQHRSGLGEWRRAGLGGVLVGLVWGAALALVLWLLLPAATLGQVVAAGLSCGLVYGVVAALVAHGVNHADQDPTWAMQPVAARYEVQAPADEVERAQDLLERMPVEVTVEATTARAGRSPRPPRVSGTSRPARGRRKPDEPAKEAAPETTTPAEEPPTVSVTPLVLPAEPPSAWTPARRRTEEGGFVETDMESTAARRYRFDT